MFYAFCSFLVNGYCEVCGYMTMHLIKTEIIFQNSVTGLLKKIMALTIVRNLMLKIIETFISVNDNKKQ